MQNRLPTLTDTKPDSLILEVADFDVNVLTGIYSEETKLPQPLRFTIQAEMLAEDHYGPDTPLAASRTIWISSTQPRPRCRRACISR